jgi:hypothetical protein
MVCRPRSLAAASAKGAVWLEAVGIHDGQRCAEARGCDQVVATGVAKSRQGVVLHQQRYRWPGQR